MILRKPASSLTLWTVACESRQIISRPCVVTEPVRTGSTGSLVPPELLERTIPLFDDLEAEPCR
jgi:hypothetical protein